MVEYSSSNVGRGKRKWETRNYYCENIKTISGPCDVFINHRGSDTKKNIAGLLYDHLSRLGIKPFMDSRNMKPGDKLSHEIDAAIENCKVAVALLSRNYCESRHCLRELTLLMQSNKRVLPIFWDVKPAELRVNNNEYKLSSKERWRFTWALEQVKDTIGLTFDSSKGDWSEFLEVASKEVKNLLEVDQVMSSLVAYMIWVNRMLDYILRLHEELVQGVAEDRDPKG
ncbi:probable 2' cyclic ADP-D-ribose synthase BdTIR [Corylus avellana]|uniref:probable 2' cyclic ADP-D-ribose synthase BdTIR n=1 Tax=Corylus avellana TaxID=13451 RepID=UPI001E22F8FE|nr:probable 2' cyclic ADP-D-ribose synthase BdTIR [Corylus avellana]